MPLNGLFFILRVKSFAVCLSFFCSLRVKQHFSQNEDTVRTAMLFALGYLYENRSSPDYQKLTLNLRSILFAQREGVM